MNESAARAIITSRAPAHAIARRERIPIADLASAEDLATLETLLAIESTRAALTITRARAAAAEALLDLARNADAPETRRRACVDALTLEIPRAPLPVKPTDPAHLLALLEAPERDHQ